MLNKLFVLALPLIFFFSLSSFISAQGVDEFYTKKFNDYGFRTYFFDLCVSEDNNCLVKEPVDDSVEDLEVQGYLVKEVEIEDEEVESDANSLVLLTSYLQASDFLLTEIEIDNYNNVFVICDSEFQLENELNCSSLSTDGSNTYVNLGTDEFESELGFIKQSINNKTYYFIPEGLFTTASYTQRLDSYFDSVKANQRPALRVQPNTSLDVNSIFLETSIYTLIALLFVIIFYHLFKRIKKVSDLQKLVKFNTQVILDFLNQYRNFAINFLLIGSVLLVSLLISVAVVDTGGLSISYIKSFIIYSLSKEHILSSFSQSNIVHLTFVFVLIALTLLLISLFLPNFFYFVKNYFDTFKSTSINKNETSLKYIPVILIFTVLFFILVLPLDDYYFPLMALSLLIFFLTLSIKEDIVIYDFFNKKERQNILLSFVLIVLIGLFGNVFLFKDADNIVRREDLVGIKKPIVTLPYFKDFDKPIEFNPHLIKPDARIFVDDYLVYSSVFSEIKNRNFSGFDNNDYNFIISQSPKDIPQLYYLKDTLRNAIESSEATTSFYVENLEAMSNSPYYLLLDFDCINMLESKKLDISVTKEGRLEEIETNISGFFIFPGCKKTSNSYSIPLLHAFYSEDALINLTNSNYVNSVSLLKNSEIADVNYLLDFNNLYIEVNNISSTTIYNFGEDLEEIDFRNNLEEQLDLSKNINLIISRDLVESPFKIWSDTKNLIIRNEYVK